MARRISLLALMATALVLTTVVRADVKTQEKSTVKFEGFMGRMMAMFGGAGAAFGEIVADSFSRILNARVVAQRDRSPSFGDLGSLTP